MVLGEGYIVTKKVNVSEFFEGAEPDMSIEFRELDVQRGMKLTKLVMKAKETSDHEESSKYFYDVLPSIIVDHDFWKTESIKYSQKEVSDILRGSTELFMRVMGEYIAEVLFTHGKKSAEK